MQGSFSFGVRSQMILCHVVRHTLSLRAGPLLFLKSRGFFLLKGREASGCRPAPHRLHIHHKFCFILFVRDRRLALQQHEITNDACGGAVIGRVVWIYVDLA